MIRQRRGNIVNISSTSGRKGLAYDSAYCASKFGVIGLSEALAEEMRQYGIRVQILLPGAIETGMWDQNGPIPRPDAILTPERVAELILYLVTMPEDMVLGAPIIEPFRKRTQPKWLSPAVDQTGSAEQETDEGKNL
jgi:3-oxoacyl-[acyl-carrier protein] reductase